MSGLPSDERHPGLTPPRFGLGTLMLWVAVMCVLFASFAFLGPSGGIALGLLVFAVLAHVAGNAIGTRLRQARQNATRQNAAPADVSGAGGAARQRRPEIHDFAPVTRLRSRDSLGKPIIFVTAAGALVAAGLGGAGLAAFLGERATLANVSLGVLACGVLGGIWTFAGFSFLQVAVGALWQASREKK
jgi:membrane protein implicated in regulation of membrane protease activity